MIKNGSQDFVWRLCTQEIYNYIGVNDPVMSKVLIGTIPFLVLALCGWGIVCLLSAGGIFDDSNTGDLFEVTHGHIITRK